MSFFFFFQAEDGIRDVAVTGVQTCALPISHGFAAHQWPSTLALIHRIPAPSVPPSPRTSARTIPHHHAVRQTPCHSEENDNPQRRHLDVLVSLFTGQRCCSFGVFGHDRPIPLERHLPAWHGVFLLDPRPRP